MVNIFEVVYTLNTLISNIELTNTTGNKSNVNSKRKTIFYFSVASSV